MNKICPKCNEEKEIGQFPKDKTRKHGIYPYCRACQRERSKIYWDENKSRQNEKRRERTALLNKLKNS